MPDTSKSDADLTARLQACYTGVVHDVMRELGLRNFVLPATIRPLIPDKHLAGPVFTLSGRIEPTADPHETLLQWTGFLGKAPPGSVVVCQPNDSTIAHMGELSAETLQRRGVRGYLVDGGCRDVERVVKIGFPVFCRYATPRDVVGHWLPDGMDVPIRIGETDIHPGDYLLADRDGTCVLPQAGAEEIVTAAEATMQTENKVRRAILDGMDPQEAYLKYGKF
ncbi:RraA family protein [Pelagibius sp.]|uniref:RraA family protein n=1 Tax=Pelagibius sp. TaxID=1931238 RepID=UPI002607ED04|nr:RraA family protein [Pelagibius sp.]